MKQLSWLNENGVRSQWVNGEQFETFELIDTLDKKEVIALVLQAVATSTILGHQSGDLRDLTEILSGYYTRVDEIERF